MGGVVMTVLADALILAGGTVAEALRDGENECDAFQRAADELETRMVSGYDGADAVRALVMAAPPLGLAWRENAYACVHPTHKLAASLMCTSAPAEIVNSVVELPWHCFGIRVPDRLFGDMDAPDFIAVMRTRNGHIRVVWMSHDICGFAHETSLGAYIDRACKWNPNTEDPFGLLDDVEHSAAQRFTLLVSRLIVGVCIEMDNPEARADAARISRAGVVVRKGREVPSTHHLVRPVKVDVRRSLQLYVGGGGQPVTVQTLVRGHHKMQPHGPGSTLRKWIHIEPHWRGPEDAPVAVRPHTIGGE